jgi:hypothetical protein
MRRESSTNLVAVSAATLVGLVLLACSGTSTGTGTADGGSSGSSGNSGNGGKDGGGIFNGVPTSCSKNSADDACTACLKLSCCTETLACSNDAECVAVLTCSGSCGPSDSACNQSCVQAHPSALSTLQTLVACEQKSCLTACEGGSSSPSPTPTATGSGTPPPGCTPTGPGDCTNAPYKVGYDCGSRPAPPGCVAPPGAVTGIYCCPQ